MHGDCHHVPANVADEVSRSTKKARTRCQPSIEYTEPFIDLLPINSIHNHHRQKFQYSINITEEPDANLNSFLELTSSRQNTTEGR